MLVESAEGVPQHSTPIFRLLTLFTTHCRDDSEEEFSRWSFEAVQADSTLRHIQQVLSSSLESEVEGTGFGGSLLHLLRLGSISGLRVVQVKFGRGARSRGFVAVARLQVHGDCQWFREQSPNCGGCSWCGFLLGAQCLPMRLFNYVSLLHSAWFHARN